MPQISWEAFDEKGISQGNGFSDDRFAPSKGGVLYFKLTWENPDDADTIGELTYFFEIQGTGVPKVRGFISDASTKQRIADVTVTNNLQTPIFMQSSPIGFYWLHVRDSNVQLTFEKDGYLPLTANIDAVVNDQHWLNVEMISSSQAISDFVTRFYRLVLGREPEINGLNGWVAALQTGQVTSCGLARGFIGGPEFTNRNLSDEAYVDVLYNAILNRKADIGGKNGWLNALRSGVARETVLEGFLSSPEFTQLANSFGIGTCSA